MKLKNLLVLFALLNVIALSCYGYFFLIARHTEQARKQTEEMKVATGWEETGVTSKSDFLELRRVGERVKANHTLSNKDFDWLVQVFNKPTLKDTPAAAVSKRIWTLAPMLDAELTPDQKEALYKMGLPLLTSTDKAADDADKLYGCNVMRKLQDKRAIPVILPLLNDARPMVVKRARQALDSMGYKAG